MRCTLGCLFTILCIILIIFVLTHLGEIWQWLEGLFA
jgi:hypothetical protein